jgi:hypothetical protein
MNLETITLAAILGGSFGLAIAASVNSRQIRKTTRILSSILRRLAQHGSKEGTYSGTLVLAAGA